MYVYVIHKHKHNTFTTTIGTTKSEENLILWHLKWKYNKNNALNGKSYAKKRGQREGL